MVRICFYCSCAGQRKVSVGKEEEGLFGEYGEDSEDRIFFFHGFKFKTIKSRV